MDEQAYRLHYSSVVRFLIGFGAGDAEDLAQETFVRFERSGNDVPADRARFWLIRVARNLALNELRRRRVRERAAALEVVVRQADPEVSLERRGELERCLTMLQSLPDDQRAAIILRDVEELSYAEIAATLDVDVSKVKSDLFRARHRLREQLGGKR